MISEWEMEELLAGYPEEFFPRRVLHLRNRQQPFAGVGRFDLLFQDQFDRNILMELKARPAKVDVADQLVKYKEALEEQGEKNVIMWLIALLIPKTVADFLDRFGVEHTEIHEAEFRQVGSRHAFVFKSDSGEKPAITETPTTKARWRADSRPVAKASSWSIAGTRSSDGSPEEFLQRCDSEGRAFFSALFERIKSLGTKARLTWNHESGFSLQFQFPRLGFAEMVWGFPLTNLQGKARAQKLVFPFDLAVRRGVPEEFLSSFADAIVERVSFTGGQKRPSILLNGLTATETDHAVKTIVEFAEKASALPPK
jgi:hypothetical protein